MKYDVLYMIRRGKKSEIKFPRHKRKKRYYRTSKRNRYKKNKKKKRC